MRYPALQQKVWLETQADPAVEGWLARNPHALRPWQVVLGLAAIAALGGLTQVIPSWQGIRIPATVVAGQTFELMPIALERWEWQLREGRFPGNGGLERQQIFLFERGERIELILEPSLRDEAAVHSGQVLGRLRSLRQETRTEQLEAEVQAHRARLALLRAGARAPEIEAARHRVGLAELSSTFNDAQAERARSIGAEGVLSDQGLEDAELQAQLSAQTVELAEAELVSLRAGERPEALNEVEATILGLETQLAELQQLQQEQLFVSPIDGLIARGGADGGFAVHDLSTAYLHFSIPESRIAEVAIDDAVVFYPHSDLENPFEATIVEIEAATLVGIGEARVQVSARIVSLEATLWTGMTGTAAIDGSPRSARLRQLWARAWDGLL